MHADFAEQIPLNFQPALICVQDERFVFLQFGGNVALRICQRLLADVIVRYLVSMRICDFYVVAEYLVIAYLQTFNVQTLSLADLQSGDPDPWRRDSYRLVRLVRCCIRRG